MYYSSVTCQSEDGQKAESGPPEHGVSEHRPLFSSFSLHCFLGCDNKWRTTCVLKDPSLPPTGKAEGEGAP